MKSSIVALLFSSFAMAQPEIILAPVDHLYVPEGFDSNDSVEVVVTGTFPNACYSRNNVEVKVVGEIVDVKVTAISPDHRNMMADKYCPQVAVPFKEVVSLGNLQGGEYEIKVNEGAQNSLADTLRVAEAASNSVDDNIYAAIEYVEKQGKTDYVLKGWRYSPCMELADVKVVSNKKDTLSILPIMKKVSDF